MTIKDEANAIAVALENAGLVRIAYESQGGKVFEESFATKSRSHIMVTIDYRYTEEGGVR